MKGVSRVMRDIGLTKEATVVTADICLSTARARVTVRTTVLLINNERTGRQGFEEADPLCLRAELEPFMRHFNDDVALGKRVNEEVGLAKRRCIVRVYEPTTTFGIVKAVDRITSGASLRLHSTPIPGSTVGEAGLNRGEQRVEEEVEVRLARGAELSIASALRVLKPLNECDKIARHVLQVAEFIRVPQDCAGCLNLVIENHGPPAPRVAEEERGACGQQKCEY
jgi:hypothetical protein